MHRVIITNFDRPIQISNDGFVPLMDRMISMVEDQIKSGEYADREEELDSLLDYIAEDSNLLSEVGKRLKKLKDKSAAN